MTPEQRAEMMWRIHPKDLQTRGITRVEFYAAQIREAIAEDRKAKTRRGRGRLSDWGFDYRE